MMIMISKQRDDDENEMRLECAAQWKKKILNTEICTYISEKIYELTNTQFF